MKNWTLSLGIMFMGVGLVGFNNNYNQPQQINYWLSSAVIFLGFIIIARGLE